MVRGAAPCSIFTFMKWNIDLMMVINSYMCNRSKRIMKALAIVVTGIIFSHASVADYSESFYEGMVIGQEVIMESDRGAVRCCE